MYHLLYSFSIHSHRNAQKPEKSRSEEEHIFQNPTGEGKGVLTLLEVTCQLQHY